MEKEEEIAKRFNIDLEALKKEQIKLAKTLEIKDVVDFSNITRFAAIENIIIKNRIISAIIICDKEFNIIEQQYSLEKASFPYLYEFRSYREMPAMMSCFSKLTERPDIVFISGHGITHPRLGLASHFSIYAGVPTIGIADSLFKEDSLSAEDILKEGKKVGKFLQSKEKGNPLFISPGNKISLESAYNITKKLIIAPHKYPQPIHLAHKYAKSVKKELSL